MKAFLLAAGKGTRLRPYTDKIPKCLMPIGETPLLEIWIALLARHGVEKVLINTGHLAEQVHRFVDRARRRYTIGIELVHEPRLLGSGGTLWENRGFVAGERDFVIAYADNLTDIDLSRMMRHHRRFRERGGVLTMALFHAPDPKACGIATLGEEGRIVSFEEKPRHPAGDLANGGVYVASGAVFDFFPTAPHADDAVLDFGHHVLPRLAGRMFGYPVQGYLKDIGTVSAYREALEQWGKRL